MNLLARLLLVSLTGASANKVEMLVELGCGSGDEDGVVDDIIASSGAVVEDRIKGSGMLQVSVNEQDVETLQNVAGVDKVESNPMVYPMSTDDINYPVKLVQAYEHPEDDNTFYFPKIDSATASDACSNPNSFKVAIIDSGMEWDHPQSPCHDIFDPEKANCIGTNEFMKQEYIDEGQDWYNPVFDHGTHVQGIIGATHLQEAPEGFRNSMNPDSTGICYIVGRVFPDSGASVALLKVLKAIDWAVGKGAKVVNMSIGTTFWSTNAQTYFNDYIKESDAILVASSGNSGNTQYQYPAAFENVIGVGSVDSDKVKAASSTYNDMVDIAAPGVDIYNISPGGTYKKKSGTSQASAFVTGAITKIWKVCTECDAQTVHDCVISSAEPVNGQTEPRSDEYGHGILQTHNALACLVQDGCCEVALESPAPTTSGQATSEPSTSIPTETPTRNPTDLPTQAPSVKATVTPTANPTSIPTTASPTTIQPSTAMPTRKPTEQPTHAPSAKATTTPTPTSFPTTASPTTSQPSTARPTKPTTENPTVSPSVTATATPTANPTPVPTTASPTSQPSTATPTARKPTEQPTISPSAEATATRTPNPTSSTTTATPTATTTQKPTEPPTNAPSIKTTATPTATPTANPTSATTTATPTANPTPAPTTTTTATPTANPTSAPITTTTAAPTANPTSAPTTTTTVTPTANPTSAPTITTTATPTANPVSAPTTTSPTNSRPLTVIPTATPTRKPIDLPTQAPSTKATASPTANLPTDSPATSNPTMAPTRNPTYGPTSGPTSNTTNSPTVQPTLKLGQSPTAGPTSATSNPTNSPTDQPTLKLTPLPTAYPTSGPTNNPTSNPTNSPTDQPTLKVGEPPTAGPTSTCDGGNSDMVILDNNFEDPTHNDDEGWVRNWRGSATETSPGLSTFLGRLGKGKDEAIKLLVVPQHSSSVLFEFLFYEIDHWENPDQVYFRMNNNYLSLGSFHNRQNEPSISGYFFYDRPENERVAASIQRETDNGANLGFSGYSDQKHRVTMNIPSFYFPRGSLIVGFKVSMSYAVWDEAAGFDDIRATAICGGTRSPTEQPTLKFNQPPTSKPTTYIPTATPTNKKTTRPTPNPTNTRIDQPTLVPTITTPTCSPTSHPTRTPTQNPTPNPTNKPTSKPTNRPTQFPTLVPTDPLPSEEDCSECLGFLKNYNGWWDFKAASKQCKKISSDKAEQKACKNVVKMVLRNGKDSNEMCKIYGWCLMPSTRARRTTECLDNPTSSPTMPPTKEPTEAPTKNTSAPTTIQASPPTKSPTVNPTANPTITPTDQPTLIPTYQKPDEAECDTTECLEFLGNYNGWWDFKTASKKCKKISSDKAKQKVCKNVAKDVLTKGLAPRNRCEVREWCS